jgi:DNA replication protein DnaC
MTTDTQTLEMLLRVLKLPGFAAHYAEQSKKA